MYGSLLLIGLFSPNILSGHFGPEIGSRTFIPLLEALENKYVQSVYTCVQLQKQVSFKLGCFETMEEWIILGCIKHCTASFTPVSGIAAKNIYICTGLFALPLLFKIPVDYLLEP